jgi:ElaA protein
VGATDAGPIRDAGISEIDPATLYRLLALRVDVFVVEQRCPYPELDGRDLEPSARLVWIEIADVPVATLRLLTDPDGATRIGRVATAREHRGRGLAAQLMRYAIERSEHDASGAGIVLDAQVQLQAWYESFGFVRAGDDFDEDAIRHVPMRRGPATPAQPDGDISN